MSNSGISGPMNELGLERHCEPKELIGRLAVALRERDPGAYMAAPVLVQLSEALSHRFEREDDDFDAAIQRAPWLTAGVLQLKEQHGQMLQIVDELQVRMQDKDDFSGWPVDLGDQLEQLIDLFHEHVTVECSLLQESCDQPEWIME
ncbi:MAG: hemerythrin domain-containing protein [Pirellulaceae bacterium]